MVTVTPPRRPGSVRRTTTHDCTRPGGLDGPVTVVALGRDLRTDAHGRADVVDRARVDMQARFPEGTIIEIRSEPAHPTLAARAGATAYSGFRRAVADAMPEAQASGSVCFQLLDDIPIALMLSGRVPRALGIGIPRDPVRPLPVDICAGWADGGELLTGFTEFGPPLHVGPVAVPVEADDDDTGWHEHDALPSHSTRRRRRIDVWIEDGLGQADAFFRDSHADANGSETVVHEYSVRAAFDRTTHEIVACDAIPGPLPYIECPAAAASAHELRGVPVRGLRSSVTETMLGPSTCTHLNDALRSLADITKLLNHVK